MRGSVEELLDIATDSFEDGERCPNVCVAVSKALRLALGGDCVEDAVARAVGKVVLAEHAGIVSPGVGEVFLLWRQAKQQELKNQGG